MLFFCFFVCFVFVCYVYGVVFFFSSRRRHTRWPRDWSSDVCSSDLRVIAIADKAQQRLCRRFRKLAAEHKPAPKSAVANRTRVGRFPVGGPPTGADVGKLARCTRLEDR